MASGRYPSGSALESEAASLGAAFLAGEDDGGGDRGKGEPECPPERGAQGKQSYPDENHAPGRRSGRSTGPQSASVWRRLDLCGMSRSPVSSAPSPRTILDVERKHDHGAEARVARLQNGGSRCGCC